MFLGILLSSHLGFTHDYNAVHPHIGTYISDSWLVGAYYNSERRVSAYIANEIDLSNSFKVEIGLVTGYSTSPLQPMVKLNYKNLFVVPATEHIDSQSNVGLVVGLEWRY